MADDDDLFTSGENVFNDAFELDEDEVPDFDVDGMPDVPSQPADYTVVGLSSAEDIEDLIRQVSGNSLGFQTAEERASLLGVLQSMLLQARWPARQSTGPANRDPGSDPYEFRLTPITGINQANLPDEGLVLPLPPEKFEVEKSSDPRTFISINQVEFTLPGPNTGFSIALEGMFPYVNRSRWLQKDRDFVVPSFLPRYMTASNYKTPDEMVTYLDALRKAAQPVQLTIAPADGDTRGKKVYGGLVGTNWVTVVGFTYGEAFGHVADYVFTLQLKQWRGIYSKIKPPATGGGNVPNAISDPVAGIVAPPASTKPTPPITSVSPGHKPRPTTHTVRTGDTLWDLAAKYLGTGTRWMEIYSLNKGKIQDACRAHGVKDYPRGWVIFPGTKLKIPPRGQRDGS